MLGHGDHWRGRFYTTDSRVLLGVSLLSAFLCGSVVGCNKTSHPTSPSSTAATDFVSLHTQRLLANPDIHKVVRGEPPTEAAARLDTLARRGFKRLSHEQLLQRAILRGKLLLAVDVKTCAAIVRDTATEAQMNTALATLEAIEVEKFFALKEAAILAEVKGQRPPAMVQEEEFPEAFGALLSTLPQDRAEHLAQLLSSDPSRASHDDICWAERTFLGTLVSLGEPHRGTLVRGVVQ